MMGPAHFWSRHATTRPSHLSCSRGRRSCTAITATQPSKLDLVTTRCCSRTQDCACSSSRTGAGSTSVFPQTAGGTCSGGRCITRRLGSGTSQTRRAACARASCSMQTARAAKSLPIASWASSRGSAPRTPTRTGPRCVRSRGAGWGTATLTRNATGTTRSSPGSRTRRRAASCPATPQTGRTGTRSRRRTTRRPRRRRPPWRRSSGRSGSCASRGGGWARSRDSDGKKA
mmetsp:Transcript_66392/g.163609  ORF Transcript_66392/g.163609 Transcript_66392/m.163609 type:complete len:230 (+) Transcript_66392:778-1467(+)